MNTNLPSSNKPSQEPTEPANFLATCGQLAIQGCLYCCYGVMFGMLGFVSSIFRHPLWYVSCVVGNLYFPIRDAIVYRGKSRRDHMLSVVEIMVIAIGFTLGTLMIKMVLGAKFPLFEPEK